jgi:methionine-rich copper-binding protein CopC
VALLGIVLAAALAVPALVFAHADYDHSVPDKDEVVPESPPQIDVYFKQEVFKQEGANYVRVFDDAGTQVSEGDGVVDDDDRTHISAALQPDLPPGRYIVQWQTLSDEDGDSDDGSFCFFVAVEPSAAEAEECAALAGDEEETPEPTADASPTEPVEATAAPAASPTAEPASDADGDDDGTNTALIAGGIAAAVVVVLVVGGGAVVWLRRTLE